MRIHLISTAIIPWFEGIFSVDGRTVSTEEARAMLEGAEVVFHIGHDATAQAFGAVLGRPVAFDRTPWDGSGTALVLQMHRRIEEGQILSFEEMERIGFGFRTMRIVRPTAE